MKDQEVLELAAKAAGIEITWGKCAAHLNDYEYLGVTGPWISKSRWNPLTDDGDALRLAVKLGIVLSPSEVSVIAWRPGAVDRDAIWESLDQDPYAATRRAIVRAAAEIGKLTKD